MAKVKICGIRRVEDAVLAAALGADALGFVFWPSSPRFIDPYRARPILRALPPFVTAVGVFVDQPWEFVASIGRLLGLGAVQLHGNETPESYARSPFRVIKGVAVAADEDVMKRVSAIPSTATVLLDAHDPIKRGGTGKTIDWNQAAAIAQRRPVILSGGLTADNIGAAILTVKPYAVDVSSGVETSPGVKDPEKLRKLIDAVRQVGSRTAVTES
jgi:phosphoribosylanthranilate isomerase